MALGRGTKVAIGVGAGLIVVAGGLAVAKAAGLLMHDSTRAVTLSEAVQAFRESGGKADAFTGVYPLATSGTESVDALGGAHHTYPAATSLTVTRVPCGVALRWDGLSTRRTTWTLCAAGGGWQLRTYDQGHAFFGQHDRTVYACGTTPLIPADPAPGATWRVSCRSASNTETGTGRVVGREEVTVGGRTIDTVHVRLAGTIGGHDAGNESTDWWFDPSTALPVRIEIVSRTSRKFLFGNVHYREDAHLRLASATPRH